MIKRKYDFIIKTILYVYNIESTDTAIGPPVSKAENYFINQYNCLKFCRMRYLKILKFTQIKFNV